MKSFTLTQLTNNAADVTEAVQLGPVDITRHGKRKYVLMTAERYDEIRNAVDPHRVFSLENAPADIIETFRKALEKGVEHYDD